MSTLEDGAWTPIEIDSLRAAIGDGLSMEEVAEVLDRKIDDVVEKCLELGLRPHWILAGPVASGAASSVQGAR